MSVLPVFEHGGIKLGSVVYYKRDRVRSILVGIAPIFGGTAVSYGLYRAFLLLDGHLWWQLLILWQLFIILTNMFSSPQDLEDVVFLIPLALAWMLIGYIAGFDLIWFAQTPLAQLLADFSISMVYLGGGALLVHIWVWGSLKWWWSSRSSHRR
jgi:hypothetical protein